MSKQPKKIAIYGKGGIGKSTTTSNISAALAESGYRVMQIGCDPKSDSTNTLRGGNTSRPFVDLLRNNSHVDAHEAIFEGFGGIYCVEAGGPQPGVGCAGRGIITAVELLKQQNVFEELELDYVIFDVLGDVVCGGFAVPIRESIAEHVFTVSSADFMAIYAANNLFKGIQKYSTAGGALLGGVIANSINTEFHRRNRERLRCKDADPGRRVRASLTYGHSGGTPRQDHNRSGTQVGASQRLSTAGEQNCCAHGVACADPTRRRSAARLVRVVGRSTDRSRTRCPERGGVNERGHS
ncbi:MAG: AAA family ATPase [Polyangiaceae bacterium]